LDQKPHVSQVELKLRMYNATAKTQLMEMTMHVESLALKNNIVSAEALTTKPTDVCRKATMKNQFQLDKKQLFVPAQLQILKLEILQQVLPLSALLQVYLLHLSFAEYE
jgi:hypothetical protein